MPKAEVQTTEDAIAQGQADARVNAKLDAKADKSVKGVNLEKNVESARQEAFDNSDVAEEVVAEEPETEVEETTVDKKADKN